MDVTRITSRNAGLTRRRFLQAAALVGTGLALPRGFAVDDPLPALNSILQAYTERAFTQAEMNDMLLNRPRITYSTAALQQIKRQQFAEDGAPRTLVAALGDSVLWSMYLGLLRPEIKHDPRLVQLGDFAPELGGVLARYNILSYDGGIFGVVQGSTTADLIHNAAICAEGCLPNESLLDAVVRHQPAVVFICTGRIIRSTFTEFAQQLHTICETLLGNAIVPVVILPPLVLQKNGSLIPDIRDRYDDDEYWQTTIQPLLDSDQVDFLPRVVWMSYYADAMGMPTICPLSMMYTLDDFGFAADEIYRHFSSHRAPDDYATVLHDLSQPLAHWSGSEVMNYLVLAFLKIFDDLSV